MLGFAQANDSPGMGMTSFKSKLAAAMGQAGADMFFSTWYANIVTQADVTEWASWGVNSVRLAMNYHELTTADGTWIDAGFQWIDAFIAWCKAAGIYVILDLHAAPGAQNCEEMSDTPDGKAHLWTEPQKYRQWTIDLWQTIAKRYASEPAVMGYDLFDEPYEDENSGDFPAGAATTLLPMYQDLTKAIRAVDAHHILIFEGAQWSTGTGFSGLEAAATADPQTAWSFHEYIDLNNNTNMTQSDLDPYISVRTATNRPIWHGETGEHNYAWLTNTIKLDEMNKIGWNMWTYKKANEQSTYDPSGADPTSAYDINEPASYSAMRTYLQGGAAPSQSVANTVMMALATNAATTTCQYNAGWVKAVFNK
jgi:aryl-phospho-beta-D-glucosidase BglC (GH1 family)